MTHLSDQELVLSLDGEHFEHLAACPECRARKQELENAMAVFVEIPKRQIPPADVPRATLKARLAEQSTASQNWWAAAGICAVLITGLTIAQFWPRQVVVSSPNPRLTPGAAALLTSSEVCQASNTKNKAVPVALRQKVFEAYGIKHATLRDYEVDYLITPALGGADDIHNLWPQSYSDTLWNAQAKDDLEDYLREMVCGGKLDLATAQREIAENWIGAYQKYFHTDRPR
jgi:hypothetical protein